MSELNGAEVMTDERAEVEEAGVTGTAIGDDEITGADVEAAEGPDPELDAMVAAMVAEGEDDPAEAPATPDRPTGLAWAMDQIINLNDEVMKQQDKVDDAAARLKAEKRDLESLQDQLNRLISEAKKAKTASEPDPVRFPLFDQPKDEINQLFAKPESIPPLPADNAEEFYRRKKRDARFDAMGLKPKVVEILAEAGFRTVLDLDRLNDSNLDVTSIATASGKITEKRGEEIRDAVADLVSGWVDEWNALNPVAEAAAPDTAEKEVSDDE